MDASMRSVPTVAHETITASAAPATPAPRRARAASRAPATASRTTAVRRRGPSTSPPPRHRRRRSLSAVVDPLAARKPEASWTAAESLGPPAVPAALYPVLPLGTATHEAKLKPSVVERLVLQEQPALVRGVSASLPLSTRPWLRTVEETPLYLREPFVLTGYRPELKSWSACVATLFRWHNQLGEIYTHLVPLTFYSAVGVWTVRELPPAASDFDRLLFTVYFMGVAICFGCSALFHMGSCHSEHVHDWLYRVDRAGMVAPFLASMLCLTYYAYACEPMMQMVHMGAACVTSSLVLGFILFGSDHPGYAARRFRLLVSFAMFGVGLASVIHMAMTTPHGRHLVYRFGWTYVAYGIGTFFYVSHVPERWWPGAFDYLGKSHQLWHIAVVIGAVNFYYLMLETFRAHLRHASC